MLSEKLRSIDRPAAVAFIFLILTLLMSYPLIFNLSDHVIGTGTADTWQFPWNNYVFRESILHGKDPYYTDKIYNPEGASLLLHTNTEFDSVLGLILSPFFNEIAQLNIGILLSTFLSAIGTYLLTKRLTGSTAGGLFAGIAFAFCPFRTTRFFGHINFALTQTLPFALLVFIRLAETHLLRYAILMGVLFALTYYCNQYYAVYLVIAFSFMLAYGIWRIASWQTSKLLRNLSVSGISAFLLLSPIAWHFYLDRQEKVIEEHKGEESLAVEEAIQPQDFVKSGPINGLAERIWGTDYLSGPHGKVTTGWIVLILAITGTAFSFKQKSQNILLLALTGILFLSITLGPHVSIGGFNVPLPYFVLMKIPYINHVRLPYRAAAMVALLFAVPAGYAVSLLSESKLRWKNLILLFLFIGVLFEMMDIPLYLSRFHPPKIYYAMRNMEDGVLLILPFHITANASHQMKFQMIHRKALLNGRIARPTPLRAQQAYLNRIPVARTFTAITKRMGKKQLLVDRNIKKDKADALAFRQFFNVRYLALHDRFCDKKEILDYIAAIFPDARPLAVEPGVRVFELPPVRSPLIQIAKGRKILFFLYSGWKPKGGAKALCLENEAKLLLPQINENQTLTLAMNVMSDNPLVLGRGKAIFKVDSKPVGEIALGEQFQRVQLSIPGRLLLEGHRLMKIELVDLSNGNLLSFPELRTTKMELRFVILKNTPS